LPAKPETAEKLPSPIRATFRVMGIERAGPEVYILRLEEPEGRVLSFRPGQYVRLFLGDFEARDYSLAIRPGSPVLEFHIRDYGSGGASGYVAEHLRVGDFVELEGPFGNCYLRDALPRPILAIAGGTGLAPLKAIVEQALDLDWRQPIHLYFGVRRAKDLYLLQHFADLSARHPNFHFVPVVSEDQAQNCHRKGLVTDAVGEDFADLSDHEAYVAGPPAMVEAARELLRRRGLASERIHADAFTLGPAQPQP
jgi:ferredoxin-NAD(P)+ reductase (naphthalene dioxygenase ferredoxin-specific)